MQRDDALGGGDRQATSSSRRTGGRGQNGAMIIDGIVAGWCGFRRPRRATRSTNLQVSSYDGKPVLTYWQGHIDLGVGFGSDVILGQ